MPFGTGSKDLKDASFTVAYVVSFQDFVCSCLTVAGVCVCVCKYKYKYIYHYNYKYVYKYKYNLYMYIYRLYTIYIRLCMQTAYLIWQLYPC